MDVTIRRGRPEDYPAILELDSATFGADHTEDEIADIRAEVPPEQFLLAIDDEGRVVGATADLDLAMTLPGGADAPVSGITWVTVDITHRRRGILRALLDRQVREHAAAGSIASVLLAAEGGIYGRFGFGMATTFRATSIDRTRVALAHPVDASRVRRVTTAQAREHLPELYERWRRRTPGGVRRSAAKWQRLLADHASDRAGWSGLHHLVHPDGYVSFRLKENWTTGDAQSGCRIVDYAPVTDDAHAALWRTLLAMDLVTEIESDQVPLDDPLPWLLTDPRKLRTTMVRDGLFVRPLDVARLLAARTYGADVEAVIEVSDPLLGDARYLLRATPDEVSCARTERSPDIRVGVATLGAASLGGVRLGQLARAGLVDYFEASVLNRLDCALLADRAPAHGTFF